MNGNEIKARLDSLVTERKNLDNTYELIEKFIAPYRGEFFRNQSSENEIDWRKREVFDSTAIYDAVALSNTVQSWLFPMDGDIFGLKFRDDSTNDDQEALEWLDDCTDRMHKQLRESNLITEGGELVLDKVAFGTGYMLQEVEGGLNGEDFNIRFSAIPVKEMYFDEDYAGQIVNAYRLLMWTPSQVISKFGDDTPESVKKKYETRSTDKIEVVFCVYRRKDIDKEVDGVAAPEKRPYGFKYILKETAETMGEEGGYYEMPIFLSRWSKVSESKYGFSPAMIALSDVLTLNQMKELKIRRAELEIAPPQKVTERGLLSDYDTRPFALNVVRTIDAMAPLDLGGNASIVELSEQELTESIHRAFYLDAIALKESPQMTATESIERTRIMQRMLGPVISRNKPSLLQPMVERTFNSMLRANLFPKMPESLANTGAKVDIVYTGPMSMAQKMEGIAAGERFINDVGMLAQFQPEVIDNVDFDAVTRDLQENMAIPAKWLKPKAEVDDERNARKQQQAQMQEAVLAEQQGNAAKAVSEGEKELMQ